MRPNSLHQQPSNNSNSQYQKNYISLQTRPKSIIAAYWRHWRI